MIAHRGALQQFRPPVRIDSRQAFLHKLRISSMGQTTVEHRCLPRTAQPCPHCGELIDPPVSCGVCGANVSASHICPPHPLQHICPPLPPTGRCLECGQTLPARQFCPTCGADIMPSHRCPAAPPTHVHRADPLHHCPVLPHERCPVCGELMPPLSFCPDCGMETTAPHVCHPTLVQHVCPPHLTMPRRCSHCGATLPSAQHCTQCGADITPGHVCDPVG